MRRIDMLRNLSDKELILYIYTRSALRKGLKKLEAFLLEEATEDEEALLAPDYIEPPSMICENGACRLPELDTNKEEE